MKVYCERCPTIALVLKEWSGVFNMHPTHISIPDLARFRELLVHPGLLYERAPGTEKDPHYSLSADFSHISSQHHSSVSLDNLAQECMATTGLTTTTVFSSPIFQPLSRSSALATPQVPWPGPRNTYNCPLLVHHPHHHIRYPACSRNTPDPIPPLILSFP